MRLELWQNYGISYKKNTEVKVLPGEDLFQESAILTSKYFFVGDATQVQLKFTGQRLIRSVC